MRKLTSLLLALILVMSIAPVVIAEGAPTKLTYVILCILTSIRCSTLCHTLKLRKWLIS